MFAILLAKGIPTKVSDTLLADFESTCRDPLEAFSAAAVERRPKLATPSIVALIQEAASRLRLEEGDRDAMLAASCLALAPTDRLEDVSAWMAGLRQTYRRRHAFREELTRATASLEVSPVA